MMNNTKHATIYFIDTEGLQERVMRYHEDVLHFSRL